VSCCLDTNVLVSMFFADADTNRAFTWLARDHEPICVSDWAATKFFALVWRRAPDGLVTADIAGAAILDFDAFAGNRAQRLSQSAAAEAPAALLARDPALKLSAAALQLALNAEGGHCLVTFDARLVEAASARGFNVETP